MSIETMKLALEALEAHADIGIKSDKAITALRAAIEQAEKREWVGLTYKERCELWNISSKFSPDSVIMHDYAKDIEQALKEKNT